jgi:hypothetical protein
MKYKITYTVTEAGYISKAHMVKCVAEVYERSPKQAKKYSDQKLLEMYFASYADEPGEFLAHSDGKVDFKVEKV